MQGIWSIKFLAILRLSVNPIETLVEDDSDEYENGKKIMGFRLLVKNNFARLYLFFFIRIFAIAARLRRESALFHVL